MVVAHILKLARYHICICQIYSARKEDLIRPSRELLATMLDYEIL